MRGTAGTMPETSRPTAPTVSRSNPRTRPETGPNEPLTASSSTIGRPASTRSLPPRACRPTETAPIDTIRFGLVVNLKEGIESWRLDITDEAGKLRRSLGPDDATGAKADEVPDAIVWNGLDTDGVARDGKLTAKLSVLYRKGDLATAVAGPLRRRHHAARADADVLPARWVQSGQRRR